MKKGTCRTPLVVCQEWHSECVVVTSVALLAPPATKVVTTTQKKKIEQTTRHPATACAATPTTWQVLRAPDSTNTLPHALLVLFFQNEPHSLAVRFQHRPTFHTPGDLSASGEFCRGLPARSAHPGLLQAPAFVLVIAQALEDEVGMFSQAGNRSGGASGFMRELQRGTQVLNSVWPA